jgi:hypothetical protein
MSSHRLLRRRVYPWAIAVRLLTPIAALAAILTAPLAHSDGVGPRAALADTTSSTTPAFTKSETITRDNLVPDNGMLHDGSTCNQAAGCDDQVDQRNVTLSVDVTTGLLTDQQLTVTWSGARPSNFYYSDPNSDLASTIQEYPMVLLECRGVDDSTKPADQQISPETCWTQYDMERGLSSDTVYPPWRLDKDATATDRGQYVNEPNPEPQNAGCPAPTDSGATHIVPLIGADGTAYDQYNCPNGLRAPEQQRSPGAGLPDNATFAATDTDGTGRTKFVVWTDETNATLGCSSTVACTLVAIPIMGINCDATIAGPSAADIAQCEYADPKSGVFGDTISNKAGSRSITGQLWWAASNWNDRISVPLDFAPPANFCSTVTSKNPVLVYGSELMTEVAQQWAPTFCTDPNRTPFSQIPESEPAAVNTLVGGSTEAAFETTAPPPPSPATPATGPPIVNAPVAINGFAIATLVDDQNRNELTGLRLDARLLAKLLSESYPVLPEIARGDGGTWATQNDPLTGKPTQVLTAPGPMAKNPLDITEDPEFLALNPTIQGKTLGAVGLSRAAELMALSSNSDVIYALTSYINADPAARAFLNGTPDPWGMVVNPAYKSITLPTDFWDLKDTFQDTSLNQDPCWASPQLQVPYLPLVAAPLLYLRDVTSHMEFGLPNSTVDCVPPATSTGVAQLTTDTRGTPGFRFGLGLVSLSEAHLYGLDTAQLETQSTVGPSVAFTSADASDPSKFTFVSPSAATVRTAADMLDADPTAGTWTMNYTKLRTTAAGANAYPGTMLVSMSVPTFGVPTADATGYSQLMTFAAGNGQIAGTGFGQLPAGYLPMTAANGLGQLVNYANRAATAVADQTCEVPDITDSGVTISTYASCPSPSPSPSPSTSLSESPAPSSPAVTTLGPPPTTQATRPPAGQPVAVNRPSTAATSEQAAPSVANSVSQAAPASAAATPDIAVAAGTTPTSKVGAVGGLVPGLLIVAAAGGTASLVVDAVGDVRARRRAARFQP